MKRMKQIISLLLCLCMVFPQMSLMVSAVDIYDEGSCGEKVSWVLYSDGVLSITGSGEIEDAPWYQYNNIIKKVVINSGVTLISEHAFAFCSQLVSVELPNTMESIGEYAFQQCHALNEINIPQGVDYIGQCAFFVCESLESVKIPSSLVSLEQYVFGYCTSLKCVEIPDSISHINEGTFYNCSSLADVYYGGTNEQWENIDISDNNDGLSTATIHYNLTENDCEHSFSYYTTTGTTAYDAQTHTSHSWTIEKCSLCQETRVSNHTTEKNEHLFENDSTTCSYCRYTSVDCKHEGKILIDHARQINDSSDKTLHNIYEYKRHTCALCQSSIQFDVITYEYAPHDFNSNGYCTVCKYSLEEGCYHDTYNMPVVWTYEEISGNDEWHIRHQQSSEATCKTCKQVIDIFRNSEVLEEHSYENGVCTSCNHVEGSVTPTYTPTISDFALSDTEVPLEQSFTLSGVVNGNGDTIKALQVAVFKKDDHSQGGVHQRVEPNSATFDLSSISPIITGQTYGSMLMNEGQYDIVLYVTLTNGGSFGDNPPTQTVTVVPKSECAHAAGETSTYVGSVCRSVDDNNHEVYADKYSSVCTKCNEPFEALILRQNSAIEILPHDYSGKYGICKSEGCAHVCSHTNMKTYFDEPIEGTEVWKDNGNGTHDRLQVKVAQRCDCGVEGEGYLVEHDVSGQPHVLGKLIVDHYESNEEGHKVVGTKTCIAPGCGHSEAAESEWENHVDNDQDRSCDYCGKAIIKGFSAMRNGWSFVNAGAAFNYKDPYYFPTKRYEEVFGKSYVAAATKADGSMNTSMMIKWGGNCSAMCMTSVMFYLNMLNKEQYMSSDVNNYYSSEKTDLYTNYPGKTVVIDKNDEITKLIERYQLMDQLSAKEYHTTDSTESDMVDNYYKKTETTGWFNLVHNYAHQSEGKYIKNTLDKILKNIDNDVPLIIGLQYQSYNEDGDTPIRVGHNIVIRTDKEPVNKNGWWRVYVYDPNTPYLPELVADNSTPASFHLNQYLEHISEGGAEDRYIELNPDLNQWRYRTGGSGNYIGSDANGSVIEMEYDVKKTSPLCTVRTKSPEMMYVFTLVGSGIPTSFNGTEPYLYNNEIRMSTSNGSNYVVLDENYNVIADELTSVTSMSETVNTTTNQNARYSIPLSKFIIEYESGTDVSFFGSDSVVSFASDKPVTVKVDMDEHTVQIIGKEKGDISVQITEVYDSDEYSSADMIGTLDEGDTITLKLDDDQLNINGQINGNSKLDIYTDHDDISKDRYITTLEKGVDDLDIADIRKLGVTPEKPGTSNKDEKPSIDEDDEDYFDAVIKKIKAANDGDIIKININSKDRIPVAVINALKKKDDVTLVIRRNKGDNISLNSEMNFKNTKLSYYLISYLETLDDEMISSPTIEKENPNTGAAINHFASR